MIKSEKAVFIVSSPRHFVLACAIAESSGLFIKPILIISDDFNNAFDFYLIISRLIKENKAPFGKVFCLNKKYAIRQKNTIKRSWMKKTGEFRQFKLYREISKEYTVTHLLTSEVNSLSTQYFLNSVNKQNKVECHYIEDGLFSYVKREFKAESALDIWFKRIKYGFNYQPATINTLPLWVSSSWFLNTEITVDVKQQGTIQEINSDWLKTQFLQELSAKFLDLFNLKVESLKKIDILIFLDVRRDMNSVNKNYEEQLVAFILKSLNNDLQVAIKHHPRDSQKDLSLPIDVLSIERSLPAELILNILAKNIMLVGDFSTVFMDVKLMRPSINCQVVQTNPADTSFNQLFEDNDINVRKSYLDILIPVKKIK